MEEVVRRETRIKGEVEAGKEEILLMRDLRGGERVATVGKDGFVKV